MSDFERDLVRSLNAFFSKYDIDGIAYRIKQHQYSPQVLDVLVDSRDPKYYLGIECKSISTDKGAMALYFTQHFSVDRHGVHQVDKIDQFLQKSGREGYLAIELRKGSGRAKLAHFIEWPDVMARYKSNLPGFNVTEIERFRSIMHINGHYQVSELFERC